MEENAAVDGTSAAAFGLYGREDALDVISGVLAEGGSARTWPAFW
jgi:hypothetical protein